MTPQQLRDNMSDNLINLRRAYDICVTGYDRPALNNLAHILRNWMDMKSNVNQHLQPNPLAKFKSYSVLPAFNKLAVGKEIILVVFPDEVIINQSSDLVKVWDVKLDYAEDSFFTTISVKSAQQFAASVFGFIRKSKTSVSPALSQTFYQKKKVPFLNWVGSAAVNMRINESGKLVHHNVSREDLVRRVANLLGGSHPEGGYIKPDKYNAIVEELMNYKAFDIPLPYFILLKIAQEILEVLEAKSTK